MSPSHMVIHHCLEGDHHDTDTEAAEAHLATNPGHIIIQGAGS